jgi:hypothetical protein
MDWTSRLIVDKKCKLLFLKVVEIVWRTCCLQTRIMGERVTAPAPTSKHRPWESAQAKSYSGQGVVGSPTSLAEIFDTAFSSTVDHPPDGTDCRTGGGKNIACSHLFERV